MKRLVSIITVLFVLLTTLSVMTFPASAEMEGDWVASRAADDYKDPESYRPASGFKYEIDKGLVLISADYTNNTPYTHLHTRTPYPLKASNVDGEGNSISIQLIVTEFAYGGEDNKDHFVSFSLHSKEIFAPGQTGYGEGVSVLIRGAGNGTAIAQFFTLDDDGGYTLFSEQSIFIPTDQEGHEIYDFSVKYDGSAYKFYLCGTEFVDLTGNANLILDQYCENGAYVGVSLYTGETGTRLGATISKFQGMVPFGDDTVEPEPNLNSFADIIDSATVQEGKPALIWNAAKEQFREFHGSNLDFEVTEQGTVKVTAKNPSGFLIYSPLNEISYEAADFPVIAVLTKDCYAEYGNIYYSAGKIMGAQPSCSCEIDLAEYEYAEGWCMGILDLTDDLDWKGRVNMIRADFVNIDHLDEEAKNFEIAYVAAFRTIEDAEKFAEDYLTELLGVPVHPDQETTTVPETAAPETQESTEAPTTEAQTNAAEKSGCGAIVAAPVLIVLLGAAYVARKKN